MKCLAIAGEQGTCGEYQVVRRELQMTHGELLLKATDAEPHNRTLVFALADWLEEVRGFYVCARVVRSGGGYISDNGGGYGGYGGYGGGGGYGGYGGDGGYGGYGGGGDGGGDGYGDGYGGDGGDGYGGGDGDGDGGYGDGGDGYGDGGDGYGDGGDKHKLSRGYIMESGKLYIVCSPAGYYPYVRIGWCMVMDGFITMYNTRVIRRFGNLIQLASIAESGKAADTQLLDMSKRSNGLAIGMVSRFEECNPVAWEEDCPKPEGW